MSALFKLVLGQKVVHPDAGKGKTEGDAQPSNGDAARFDWSKSTSGPSHEARRPSVTAAAAPSSNDRQNGEAAHRGVAPTPKAAAVAAASPPAQKASPSSPASNAAGSPGPNSPRPSTPTRTLLLRIEGCTVAQDIRDALRDLLRCPDLPYALDSTSLSSLTTLLTSYAEDESITEPTLHLLANATDLDAYPSQLESNRRTIEVTMADKRHTRDELLQSLVEAVGLLLESMNATAPFWSRYYAVVLLQRLEEYEPSKVNQALLAARGVGVLLDALNETDHDNALRNQALVLLTSLTLADRELQTLLAFDNAFDSLFDLVQREGGVLGGGTVVRDSLTVVQNILRSNKATQKFFREMGCAARLAALFDSIPSELSACTAADQRRSGAPGPSPSHWPQPTVLSDKLEGLLEHLRNPDVMLNILMSVSILACVLRGYEESEEELHATQDALLRCGLLNPLTRLAFCGLAIDDATRIEAVRVLALLLDRSKRAMEEWLTAPPMVTLVRATLPYTVRVWPAPRALLSYVCETSDTTLVNAGVQLFLSTLSVPACQERVVGVFLGGLVGGSDAANLKGGPAQTNNNNNNASNAMGNATSPTAGGGNNSNNSSNAQSDPQCGSALARILLSPTTTAVEKYYTAQVFRTLISLPAAARVSESLVRVAVPVELQQQGRLDRLVQAQPGWSLSPKLTPSFFNYYVSFLLFAISGGAASQQINTAALGAYVAALLSWTGACPWAAAALVQEVAWGDALLHQTRRDGAAHLRLWSAMLIARGCLVVRAAAAAAASGSGKSTPHLQESATAAAGTALVQRFLQMVGGGAALDTILFDAQASAPAWQHPVASGLRTQTPTPYDEPFVAQVEQLVQEFKKLLSAVAGASPNASSPMSLPPLTHLSPPAAPAPAAAAASAAPATQPPPYASPPQHASHFDGPSPPHPPQHEMASDAPPTYATSGDYQLQSTSASSHAPPPASAEATHGAAPPAEPSEEALAYIDTLQAELQAVQADRASLVQAVDEWRERAEQSEAQCQQLLHEQEARAAALAAAESELAHQREVTASAQASSVSAEVVDGLRENIHLLEEALSSKDEEHQQLVDSLNMLEEQLRHATGAAASANEQRSSAAAAATQHQQQLQQLQARLQQQDHVIQQQQQQIQHQQQQLQQQAEAHVHAPPPPPPVAPQGPPPEVIAEMEAERHRLQHGLREAEQEIARLQHTLQSLMTDYQDLLVMVAELNEECVSVKAMSSMAPTPARQLADWPSASPSVERNDDGAGHATEAEDMSHYEVPSLQQTVTSEPVAAAEMQAETGAPPPPLPAGAVAAPDATNGFPNLENSLPAQGESGQWGGVESPSAQLADIARTASSMAYAEATDVLIDPTASQPSPPLPAPPAQLPSGQVLPQPHLQQQQQHPHHLNSRTSSQHSILSHHSHAAHPPHPPPPPHSHKYGGLPNPLQARQAAPHAGNRHAPRYANPAAAFFNGGATAEAPLSMLPQQQQQHQHQHPQLPPAPPMLAGHPESAWTSHHSVSTHDSPPAYHANTPAPPAQVERQQQPTGKMSGQAAHFAASPLPVLPSADDFFGGADQSFSGNGTSDALEHGASANPPEALGVETQAEPAAAQPQKPFESSETGEEAHAMAPASEAAMTFNPFLPNTSATFSDHHHATRTESVTSEKTTASQVYLPPPPTSSVTVPPGLQPPSRNGKREPSGSVSVESNANLSDPAAATATVATHAPLPLPPPPSMAHKHPVSALAGSAHHLNYKVSATQGVLPQPQLPVEGTTEENSAAAAPQKAAAAATPYNPFADFQGGDDEDDGFADLR